MSSTTNSQFVIAVSIFSAFAIFVLLALIVLIFWIKKLTKRINELEPLINFKLKRPKLINEESPTSPSFRNESNNYDNPVFSRNPFSQPLSLTSSKPDLNPIAGRTKASFDNSNFILGGKGRDYHTVDYLNRDSRFY